jgi:peptide deformylase
MIRPILVFPDPRLREVAKPVTDVDDEVRGLVDDLAETMYDAPGLGLAATQLGIPWRVFVVDVAGEDEPSALRVFINPELLERAGQQALREGCLSFPGVGEEIKRAAWSVARWPGHAKPRSSTAAAGRAERLGRQRVGTSFGGQ